MRDRIAFVLALALVAGCGDADDEAADPAAPAATAEEAAAAAAPEHPRGAEDLWAPISPERADLLPARDPRAPLDPDAVVARFEKECTGAGGGECRALRRDLELVFLADLVGLRSGGQRLDRALVRTAARARLPQLACFGLRELLLSRELTQEDIALIASALDSPWRAPREVVRSLGHRRADPVPGVADLLERAAVGQNTASAGLCLDGGRDPEPNPRLAGGYPGARYRPFASTADLRWFTTPDPPERVLAFLTKGGTPAQTRDELKAAQQARYMEETLKLSSDEPSDDATAKMMQLIFEASQDWGAPFAELERTGEIRFVMITPGQAVAVFRDDALGATSIVAARPAVFDPKALGL
jgi:hypothetical protein